MTEYLNKITSKDPPVSLNQYINLEDTDFPNNIRPNSVFQVYSQYPDNFSKRESLTSSSKVPSRIIYKNTTDRRQSKPQVQEIPGTSQDTAERWTSSHRSEEKLAKKWFGRKKKIHLEEDEDHKKSQESKKKSKATSTSRSILRIRGRGQQSRTKQVKARWTEESRETFLSNITNESHATDSRRKRSFLPVTDKHDVEILELTNVPYIGINSTHYNPNMPVVFEEETEADSRRKRNYIEGQNLESELKNKLEETFETIKKVNDVYLDGLDKKIDVYKKQEEVYEKIIQKRKFKFKFPWKKNKKERNYLIKELEKELAEFQKTNITLFNTNNSLNLEYCKQKINCTQLEWEYKFQIEKLSQNSQKEEISTNENQINSLNQELKILKNENQELNQQIIDKTIQLEKFHQKDILEYEKKFTNVIQDTREKFQGVINDYEIFKSNAVKINEDLQLELDETRTRLKDANKNEKQLQEENKTIKSKVYDLESKINESNSNVCKLTEIQLQNENLRNQIQNFTNERTSIIEYQSKCYEYLQEMEKEIQNLKIENKNLNDFKYSKDIENSLKLELQQLLKMNENEKLSNAQYICDLKMENNRLIILNNYGKQLQDYHYKVVEERNKILDEIAQKNSELIEERVVNLTESSELKSEIKTLKIQLDCCKDVIGMLKVFHKKLGCSSLRIKEFDEDSESVIKERDRIKCVNQELIQNESELRKELLLKSTEVQKKSQEILRLTENVKNLKDIIFRLETELRAKKTCSESIYPEEDPIEDKVFEFKNLKKIQTAEGRLMKYQRAAEEAIISWENGNFHRLEDFKVFKTLMINLIQQFQEYRNFVRHGIFKFGPHKSKLEVKQNSITFLENQQIMLRTQSEPSLRQREA